MSYLLESGRAARLAGAFLAVCLVGTVGAEEPPADAVRDFNAAAALQNSGLYPRAAERWNAFLKNYPDDERTVRARYCLGVCQLHNEQLGEALETFRALLAEDPGFEQADAVQYNLATVLYQLARKSEKPDDFRRAAEEFALVASRYGQSTHVPAALYFRGESLYAAGDLASAADAYQKVVQNHGPAAVAAEAAYALGIAQQELNRQAEAAATLAAFLQNSAWANHPLVGEVRLRLGLALAAQGKYEEAERPLEAAAATNGFEHADYALLRRGQCRLQRGKPEEAQAIFADLLDKFPNSPHKTAARLGVGKCRYLTDKLDDSRKELEGVLAARQTDAPEAAYWLARVLLKQEKPHDALAVLDPALRDWPEGDMAAYLSLARIDALYALPERRQEAKTLAENFLEKHPQHELAPQALYMAALSALAVENYADARRHAENFLKEAAYAQHELKPAVLSVAAEAWLAPVDRPEGGADVAQAEQLYRQLVSQYGQHPRVPRAQVRIGWCLYRMRRHDDCIRHLGGTWGSLREPADRAEARLILGRSQAELGKHADAVRSFDEALQAMGDWERADEVRLAKALSQRALDDLAGAAQTLEGLLKDFAGSTFRSQALYELGEIALAQEKLDDAVSRFREVVQKHPESPVAAAAAYGLGRACFAKQDDAGALAALDALVSQHHDTEAVQRGYYLRALVHQRLEQFDAAVADLKTFLASQPQAPDAAEARGALALCYLGQRKPAEAQSTLEAILREHADYPRADRIEYELGHFFLADEKPQEASRAFAALVKLRPDSPLAAESWYHVGRAHELEAENAADDQRNAHWEKAGQAYAAGLAKADSPELKEKLQFKTGDMQFRRGRFDEAARTFSEQLAQFGGGELAGSARFLAAESHFRLKQFDQAIPLYAKVVEDKVEPYRAAALYRWGVAAGQRERWPESEKAFKDLLGQFPEFDLGADARYGLALARQKQNKLSEARAAFAQVAEDDTSELAAKARYMMGTIDFGEKRYEDAAEQFLTVAAGYPYPAWQAQARFEAGRCFQELGNRDQAIAAFQAVVDEFPKEPKAQDAARLLAELKKE